jgi:GT2 family glycosyltransferase
MHLSIAIVNWNTRELLADCLGSLPTACADLSFEVCVVDNGSRDGSPDLIRSRFPQHRLIEAGSNLGFSRASNLALRDAQGEALLLLNPDTVCLPGSLKELYVYLQERPAVGAVGPTLVDRELRPTITYGRFPAARHHLLAGIDPRGKWLPNTLRNKRFVTIPDGEAQSGPVDYVAGACLMMRRSAWESVGPLDERFFLYFEETDWCLRARKLSLSVHHCTRARVIHLEGRSAEQVSEFSLRQFYHSYRLFVEKHHGRSHWWRFGAAVATEYSLKALARLVAPGDRRRNRALALAYFRVAVLQGSNSHVAILPP